MRTTRDDAAGERTHPDIGPSEGSPRFLLYSHDSAGLGHLRRNLTLADALTRAFPEGTVLLATGSPCATFFPLPRRVEIVKLPSISKDEQGRYVSRQLNTSVEFTLRLRRGLLLEAFRCFQPDLVLVDHQVVGLEREMLPVLREARESGVHTVLGVRDIIDAPEAVAREWSGEDVHWALEEGYDRVCIYGSPEVFDPRAEYPIPPELGRRLEFAGYVVRPLGDAVPDPFPSLEPEVLVTVGGGEDGIDRLECYLDFLERETPPWHSVLLTGPLLSRSRTRRFAHRARVTGLAEVHRFHADLPRLIRRASLVVSMAGYNTCSEILALGARSVLLPRTHPRREQELRGERLQALGLARSLPDYDPARLSDALHSEIERGPGVAAPLPMGGAERLADIASNLLGVPCAPAGEASPRDPLRAALP